MEVPTSGEGIHTCGQYSESYRNDPSRIGALYFSWAQGFMTALNAVYISTKKPYRNFGGVDAVLQEQAIREYCDQHPLGNYTDAVWSFYTSLPLREWNVPDNAKH